LQELRRVIAVRCAGRDAAITVARPLLILLWAQLNRTMLRFTAMAARVAAGRMAAPRRRPARPAPLKLPPSRARPIWPTGFGWLVRLAPEAACSAGVLQYLVTQPEMAALLAAAPQAGRLLRPLCRKLGVTLPPVLLLSRVPRAILPAEPAPAKRAPATATAPDAPCYAEAPATPAAWTRPPKLRRLAPFRPPRAFATG
jgi:hypothetical protein